MYSPHRLERYQRPSGRVPYTDWLQELDLWTRARVRAYTDRMAHGNFGISRSLGDGVFELKIDLGPGYRVYYLRDGATVVVLLCGGDKGTQGSDIRKARDYAADYRGRG